MLVVATPGDVTNDVMDLSLSMYFLLSINDVKSMAYFELSYACALQFVQVFMFGVKFRVL
jgi:hypothetical protein